MMICKLLGNRYQVVKVLNQGVFCQTYIAKDTQNPDLPSCVIKHFLPSNRCSLSPEIRRRLFVRETQALAKLSKYDCVPHLLTHFEDNLEFYVVQEFIQGHNLTEEIQPGYPWTETQVFQFLQEILEILMFVHKQGLIHRDVKPSNIMRRKQDNRLVLIDFGAVKPAPHELLDRQNLHKLTVDSTTIAIGTPGYMPHEQQRGRPGACSDIYAVGVIGIQALTGMHPTQIPENPDTGELIWQHFAQVSPHLAGVLSKMVRYHCKDRYSSAGEALNALLSPTPLPSAFTRTGDRYDQEETLISPINTDADTETLISIFPHKSALLIGLVIGVVSGMMLIVLSYFSLQTTSPTPKFQNLQLELPKFTP